jgi:hypothetical protein
MIILPLVTPRAHHAFQEELEADLSGGEAVGASETLERWEREAFLDGRRGEGMMDDMR